MTSQDDNPFAPPAYPPPSGAAYGAPQEEGWLEYQGLPGDAVTQPFAGVSTEQVQGPPAPTNQSARKALLLGALSIVLTPIAGLSAVALSRRARTEIRETGEKGAGLAKTGAWLGGAFSLLWLFGATFLIAIAVGSVAA